MPSRARGVGGPLMRSAAARNSQYLPWAPAHRAASAAPICVAVDPQRQVTADKLHPSCGYVPLLDGGEGAPSEAATKLALHIGELDKRHGRGGRAHLRFPGGQRKTDRPRGARGRARGPQQPLEQGVLPSEHRPELAQLEKDFLGLPAGNAPRGPRPARRRRRRVLRGSRSQHGGAHNQRREQGNGSSHEFLPAHAPAPIPSALPSGAAHITAVFASRPYFASHASTSAFRRSAP
jgi:hypothetical protein